jgi:hypothetical protein
MVPPEGKDAAAIRKRALSHPTLDKPALLAVLVTEESSDPFRPAQAFLARI